MSKWIAEFDLEDGDKMPEHMEVNFKGAKIDFYCRPKEPILDKTREEAIENLKILKEEYWDDDGYGHETKQYDDTMLALDMAIEALEQEPRWIPVSERLPKEDGEYLLFGKINEDEENYIFVGEYDSCGEQFGIWQEQFDRVTLGCLGSEFFEYSSVVAWQPLPKPYEESEEV